MKGSVFIATTLDGYIATKDGGVEFLDKYNEPPKDDEEPDQSFSDFLASVDCIIMGRNSFEKVLSFGAEMWMYEDKPMIVWTRKHPDSVYIPEYCSKSVTVSGLGPTELMADLEGKGYEHAYIDGGTTVQRFLAENQIHQMIITRVPLLLGDGIPLFTTSEQTVDLEHVSTKSMPNGLVTSTYKVKF